MNIEIGSEQRFPFAQRKVENGVYEKVVVPFHQVPLDLIDDPEIKAKLAKNDHRAFYAPQSNEVAGFVSPFGATRHVAQVEARVLPNGQIVEVSAFDFDQMERVDGAMDVNKPWSHATPNAMVVVLEKNQEGELLVHSVQEPRPFMYDHRVDKKGMTIVGVTGKWAKVLGSSPKLTALAGLITDMGTQVDEQSVEIIGIHNPNRAWVETCNEVYVAMFRKDVTRVSDDTHDLVMKGGVFPLGKFPKGADALVNSALWLTALHFNCVSSKPLPQE